tara:strand:- start:171 stop:593 length:423 start_codon:yes stop_codon:yes gene_type:complete
VIELFSADTPNGKKISIMLEEIGYKYKLTKIDISNGEQFDPEFVKISPFSKIPVIIDHDNNESIFESGAILIYLAEKSEKFYDKQARIKINQWLMAQMGYIGPMIGHTINFIITILVRVNLVRKDISKYQKKFIKISIIV